MQASTIAQDVIKEESPVNSPTPTTTTITHENSHNTGGASNTDERTDTLNHKQNTTKDITSSSPGIISNVLNTIQSVLRPEKTHTRQKSTDSDQPPKHDEKESKPKPTEPGAKHTLSSVFHSAIHTLDKHSGNHSHVDSKNELAQPLQVGSQSKPSSNSVKVSPSTHTPTKTTEITTESHPTTTTTTNFNSISNSNLHSSIVPSTPAPNLLQAKTSPGTLPAITEVPSPPQPTSPSRTQDSPKQLGSSPLGGHNTGFTPFHSDLHVSIPSSPSITSSPRIRSNASPQLGVLQRRASLRTHSPLSLSSASVTPPDWEARMGLDPWGFEESIAKLAEEKRKEDERRKEEVRKEEERKLAEERRKAEKAKEEAELAAKTEKKRDEPRRVVFQRAASPPPPTSPLLRGLPTSDGVSATPPSPGRARLVSSAMNVKVLSQEIAQHDCFFKNLILIRYHCCN